MIEKEKEYLEILGSSSLGSFIIDFEKKECHISKTWKDRLGLKNLNSKEVFSKYSEVIHPDDLDRSMLLKTNSIRGKKSKYSAEYRVRTIDSGYIWVLGQIKIIYNKENRPMKAYGTHIDITNRKLVEDALRESKKEAFELIEKLRKIDEQKNNFISVLSHEFRNPLATITMALSLIEYIDPGNEQDLHLRSIIKRQTIQLVRLVDDLSDVTKIEKNKIELIEKNIEINEIIEDVLDDFRVQFNEKGIILEEECYTDSIYINADSVRIKQAIGNLLSNSLRFTEKNGTVRLSMFKDESNKNAVIRISDTGIGVTPEFLPRLFKPFVQMDNSHARNAVGLGLGLSIVKGIINLHGGSIEAKSEGIGKGSEFIIRLPFL